MQGVAAVLIVFAIAVYYLSGYAQLSTEGIRASKLSSQLKQEQSMAAFWKQQQALMTTPGSIEKRANTIGMLPADEKQTITLP